MIYISCRFWNFEKLPKTNDLMSFLKFTRFSKSYGPISKSQHDKVDKVSNILGSFILIYFGNFFPNIFKMTYI